MKAELKKIGAATATWKIVGTSTTTDLYFDIMWGIKSDLKTDTKATMTNYLSMAMSEGFIFEDLMFAGYPEYPTKEKAIGATKDAFSQLVS